MEELHDKVVEAIKDNLNQRDYDVYINPGEQKNARIGDNYPDVIMTEKGKTNAQFIMEVEVDSSVTQHEAETQWKKYATEINATFYLVVPQKLVNTARQLCQNNNISARFVTFEVKNGNINFKFD